MGVTGARGSVNNKVQSLLLDIKEVKISIIYNESPHLSISYTALIRLEKILVKVDANNTHLFYPPQATNKPVAVGFGISEPQHVKQVCLEHAIA